MSRHTLSQLLRYKFDSFMSRGGSSIFVSLVVVFVSLLALVSLFRGVLLLVFSDFKKHQNPGPLILAGVASATLIGTMYIHFNKLLESIGLLELFIAALWSWQLRRRDCRQKQT